MPRLRTLLLTLAPAPILVGSMAVSWRLKPGGDRAPAANQARRAAFGSTGSAAQRRLALRPASRDARAPRAIGARLDADCQAAARDWQARLGDLASVLARPPFVLAGDLPPGELARWHATTIDPAARTMARLYFDRAPELPVTILLFRDESSYDRHTRELFGEEGVSVFGYYKPQERVLVMNIATGAGTLVHELTHALMAFDFPTAPDWFQEGLASLHEECRFSDDPPSIEGLVNWRLPALQRACQEGRLPSFRALLEQRDFRAQEALNYAHARYLCMYLQQRGLLEKFYATFRDTAARDRQGLAALATTFAPQTLPMAEDDFRQWLMALGSD